MPNKRKRTKNPHYKGRFTSYKVNDIREKNKARVIVKDARRSKPENIRKISLNMASQNKNSVIVKQEVEKLLVKINL